MSYRNQSVRADSRGTLRSEGIRLASPPAPTRLRRRSLSRVLLHYGSCPILILLANPLAYFSDAGRSSWTKAERLVWAWGFPSSQRTTRTLFIAAAVARCWRGVFSWPIERERRRPRARTRFRNRSLHPGTASIQRFEFLGLGPLACLL